MNRRHQYALEVDRDDLDTEAIRRLRDTFRAARRSRQQLLIIEGAHITDLGPMPSRIRLAQVERHLA